MATNRCYMDGVQSSKAIEVVVRKIRRNSKKLESDNLEKSEQHALKKSSETAMDHLVSFGETQVKRFREAESVCKDFYGESPRRIVNADY